MRRFPRFSWCASVRNAVISRRTMEAAPVPREERHSFRRPEYLLDRPLFVRAFVVVLIPGVYGAINGWVLGQSKTVYIVLQAIAAVGGYIGGWEHRSNREAAVRGLLGGLV